MQVYSTAEINGRQHAGFRINNAQRKALLRKLRARMLKDVNYGQAFVRKSDRRNGLSSKAKLGLKHPTWNRNRTLLSNVVLKFRKNKQSSEIRKYSQSNYERICAC